MCCPLGSTIAHQELATVGLDVARNPNLIRSVGTLRLPGHRDDVRRDVRQYASGRENGHC